MRQCILSLFITFSLYAQQLFPPSQRELNGFLLGQYDKSIAPAFTELMKEQSSEDGWIDRIYLLDSTSHSYMVFGYHKSSSQCISIQITGDPWIPMKPFLGLRIGDPKEKVQWILGKPSETQHLDDLNIDYLQYDNRNYSVELNSKGQLSSIRLTGYTGFVEEPEEPILKPDSLFAVFRSKNIDGILDLLAPDVELFYEDSVYSFSRSARDDISDSTSIVSRLIYSSSHSLAFLDTSIINSADENLRLFESKKMAIVYKFPGASRVKEIVFTVHAGKWRMWEVHFL